MMRGLNRFLCLTAAFVLLFCGTRANAQTLALRYTFENGPANGNFAITDVTGHGYDGAFAGGGDLSLGFVTEPKEGTYAGSTDPNGPRSIAVSPATTFDFTSQFTVFLWAKITDNYQIQSILGNTGGYPYNGFKFFVNSYNTQDHKIFFEYGPGGYDNQVISAPANIFDGNYHALALSVDQVNSVVKIYVDGAVLVSGPLTATFSTNNPTITLGTDGYFFSTSTFDDFRVYTGILSDAQVAALSGLNNAPGAPTNVTATGGNSLVSLAWTPVASASSYNVKRSTTNGGPYTTVATGVTTASYADQPVTNGTKYYYVVSAVNIFGESPNSAQVSATPADNTSLILRYTFEDGPNGGNFAISDVSGHGNGGTFTGSGDLSLGFVTDPKEGTYAGSTDPTVPRYIAVASSAPSFDFTSQFSVFLWAKMTDAYQIQSILGNAAGYPYNGFKLFVNSYNSQDHKVFFEYGPGGFVNQIVSAPTNLLDGNYHAIALSADQVNGLLKIYVDGTVLINTALTAAFSTSNPTISLGTDGFFASTSVFDDFRVYTGILSDSQVAALSSTGATVGGKITLEGVTNLAAVSVGAPLGTFHVSFRTVGTTTEVFGKDVTLTTTAGSEVGTYSISGVPAGMYDVAIKGSKSLRVALGKVTVGGTTGTLPDAILPAGDATNDNHADIGDFGIMVNAYETTFDPNNPNSGYDARADFNYDGTVNIGDFGLLVNEFGVDGAP